MYLAYAVSAVLAVLFWLIPIVRHLNFYVELTTSRLIVRDGIFGQKTTELSLAEIVSIELGRARTISIGRKSGEVIRLPAMPRVKRLLAELRAAAPSGS